MFEQICLSECEAAPVCNYISAVFFICVCVCVCACVFVLWFIVFSKMHQNGYADVE